MGASTDANLFGIPVDRLRSAEITAGIDRHGRFTLDPTEAVEGELTLTMRDGAVRVVLFGRDIEKRRISLAACP